jgi:peptide-methionine (S)-S-oxide reductase
MAEHEKATLGGGCFWCLEAVYGQMQGVVGVESGYMGGDAANPTYEAVCGGDTGHAEVVQLTYDPKVTSYRDILEVFFSIHDPTTLNRQGNDIGTQYRSVIFYHSEEQRREAQDVIREFTDERVWADPIVTEVQPAVTFYRAEDYHQEYFQNHQSQPYCRFVVVPKLAKFRLKFADKLRTTG